MNQNWSLFLDRDGVINELLPMDYVKTRKEFVFNSEVLEELALLSKIFNSIFVVTNQQGVGKGLMTESDLSDIHNYMLDEIQGAGGLITKVYSCTHVKEAECDCRKPKTGMLKQAFHEFPQLDHKRSILIGDSSSDIEMAHLYGIHSVGMQHLYNLNTIWTTQPDYTVNNLTELRMKVLPLIF